MRFFKLRIIKYSVAILVLVAIVAIFALLYRNSVALNVANIALKDTDLEVTSLSIDSIDTNTIYFADLVLQQNEDIQLRVIGIALPIASGSPTPRILDIKEIEILLSGSDSEPVHVASMLQAILDLPNSVPYSTVNIGRIDAPGLPPITDVTWGIRGTGQLLHFQFESFEVAMGIEPDADSGFRMSILATSASGIDAVALALAISPHDGGFAISGQSTTRTLPLIPVLHAIDLLPSEISSIDSLLRGPLRTHVYDDPMLPIVVTAELVPEGDIEIVYEAEQQASFDVRINPLMPLVTEFSYPSLDWRARVERSEILATRTPVGDLLVKMSSLDCQAGIRCKMNLAADAVDLSFGNLGIASIRASAPVTMEIKEETRLTVSADGKLSVSGVSAGNFFAGSVELTQFEGATLIIDEQEWRSEIPTMGFTVDGASPGNRIAVNFPLTLTQLTITDSGERAGASVRIDAASSSISYDDLALATLDVEGRIQIAGEVLSTTLSLFSGAGALRAEVAAQHNLEIGKGQLKLSGASLNFDARKLSGTMHPWPFPVDVQSGSIDAEAELNWLMDGDEVILSGKTRVGATSLAGSYDEIAFTGFATELVTDVDTRAGHTFLPSSLQLAVLDIGLRLEDLRAEFQIAPDLSTVNVENVFVQMLGGAISVKPFSYSFGADENHVILNLDSIQLPLMMALADFESITIEGSASGNLPVSFINEHITIDGGRLESDAPGGSIRYAATGGSSVDSQVGLVTRALSNFEFDSLTTDVAYTKDGDLLLRMRLEGVNPDMDASQPIILNLDLENNVPQLLQSLQATRSIQEIFEKRVKDE